MECKTAYSFLLALKVWLLCSASHEGRLTSLTLGRLGILVLNLKIQRVPLDDTQHGSLPQVRPLETRISRRYIHSIRP
ncbi:hypothetical protein R3P38DRAFT_1886864 [Favolaschia claudopus]|uniref:Secreted protein n=1 Tax=Favolaschia claudopus TaxID=2862362 RepID=A0AAW0DDY8_9AGAR